jgi:hypothetical protein
MTFLAQAFPSLLYALPATAPAPDAMIAAARRVLKRGVAAPSVSPFLPRIEFPDLPYAR